MKMQLWSIAGCFALAAFAFGPTRANAQLLHLWNFSENAELADLAGSADLNYAPGEGNVADVMGTAGDIVFEPGYGGVGQAYRPYYVDVSQSSTAGAGLTGSGFTSPNQFTIVALLKADQKTSGSAVNYIFQTRPGSDRGYYLVQDEDNVPVGATSGVGSVIGNNFGDAGIAAGHTDDEHWFYIAAEIDLTSNPGQAVADVYLQDLTAGGVLTQVLDDRTWNSANPSSLAGATGIFGIGNFAIDRNGDTFAEASQEWFQGSIDFIAIYDGLIGRGGIIDAFDLRLVTPEPTSAALALACVVMAAGHRRG